MERILQALHVVTEVLRLVVAVIPSLLDSPSHIIAPPQLVEARSLAVGSHSCFPKDLRLLASFIYKYRPFLAPVLAASYAWI